MNVLQISEDGRYWCYIRGQEEPKIYRETVSDGHVEREEDILEIPSLPGYYSFFLARDGIYLISKDNPKTLEYFDFAKRKLKDLFTAGKMLGADFAYRAVAGLRFSLNLPTIIRTSCLRSLNDDGA